MVARINPVRFHKPKKGETKPPMELPAALTRMAAAARKFDVASVRERDLALVAAVAGERRLNGARGWLAVAALLGARASPSARAAPTRSAR